MHRFTLCLFVSLLTACIVHATPPTVGQYEIRKRTSTGFESYGVSISNGQAFGLSGGVPAAITVGGGEGTGTVTSVALTMPNIFSVSGSPITESGTLAASLATQTANRVWAGPTTGSAATPTFRALVAADIPDLSSTYQPISGALTTLSGISNARGVLYNSGSGLEGYLNFSQGGQPATDGTKIVQFNADGDLSTARNLYFNVPAAGGGYDTSTLSAPATLNYTWALPAASGTLALTSSNISGTAAGLSTTLAIASGGTGATTAAAARTALGLGTLATQSGTFSGTSSGTNTGDQTITLTGDVTGSGSGSFAATLANTAVTPGTYGSATKSLTATVDSKGRLTALSEQTVTPAESSVTFTDITNGNASTLNHGYLPKLPGGTSTYLRADGTFATPAGAGTVTSVAASVPAFLSITGSPITSSGTFAITYSGTPLPEANGGTGITALGTGVAAALAVNTGSAGAFVLYGGAGGTPSSLTLTNATGLPVAGITSSTTTALGLGSIELGHASDTTIARSSAGNITVEGQAVYRAGGSFTGIPVELVIACSDETTALTTGTAKVTFRMPHAMTLISVRLQVNTAPTGSVIIVDVKEAGTTIFSSKPQIAISAFTSVGGAVPGTLSDTNLADDAEIIINLDQIGSTIAGKGLKVTLTGTR